MPLMIKDEAVVEDSWQLLEEIESGAALPEGQVIVPLQYWLENRDALSSRGDLGVWLNSDQPPAPIVEDLDKLPLVAVNFPVFADGRGFSYARELRENHGYTGEIRAIGHFMRDQLFYLKRCGVNAFATADFDLAKAAESLNDFSNGYQASADQPQPLFQRR